jgi:glycine/D-amino acid oxidase-like deaminating enzyme
MVGSQEDPKLNPDEELWLNESVGYVDSDLTVEAVTEKAASQGVVREKKDVANLIVDSGVCQGVELEDGSLVTAKTTIVAAGVWTPRLLEMSGVWVPDNFFTMAAVPVAILRLNDAEFDTLKTMPILVTENGIIIHNFSLASADISIS